MRLTPEDVHNIAFGSPPEGFQGYNPEDVDVFVDLLEESVRLYREDIEKLQARVAELEAQNSALPAVGSREAGEPVQGGALPPSAFPPVRTGGAKVALLVVSDHVVEQLLSQAQGESDRLLGEFAARAAQSGRAPALRPAVAVFVSDE